MAIPNDEEYGKIVKALNIQLLVLADGRNVIGEYISMSEIGGVELFCVLTIADMEDEDGELGGYATMQPFAPLSMDTVFQFSAEHIVASAAATEKLKIVYFNAMLAFTIREQDDGAFFEEAESPSGFFAAGETQWGLGDSGNLSRN